MIFSGSWAGSGYDKPGGFGSYIKLFSIVNIKFTSVSASCKCVRLHVTTRYKVFLGNLFWKNITNTFLNLAFCWAMVKFYRFVWVIFNSVNFWPGAVQLRIMFELQKVNFVFFQLLYINDVHAYSVILLLHLYTDGPAQPLCIGWPSA
jgi:hypothetical protein